MRVIPAGWRQEGHPVTRTLHQFRFIQHGTQKKLEAGDTCVKIQYFDSQLYQSKQLSDATAMQ